MQKLELTWIGKGEEPAVEPRILLHDPSKDYGDPAAENMIIHGDNLLALKALEQEYAGRVKCVYIDPPYNINAMNEYYEDFIEHSEWLKRMSPRLRILKNLLAEDGTIWIQISDEEQAYLKVLCDEIFRRANFVNLISVNMKNIAGASGGGEDKRLKKNCEFILVYAKDYNAMPLFKSAYEYTPIDVLVEQYRENGVSWKYTSVLVNEGEKVYVGSTQDGSGEEIKIYKRIDFEIVSISALMKREKLTEGEAYQKYANKCFQTAMPQSSIRPRVMEKVNEIGFESDLYSIEYVPKSGRNKGVLYEQFYKGENFRLFAWLRDVSDEIDGVLCKRDMIGTYWNLVGETKNLTKEGSVIFPNGKKPEKLLQQIFEMCTDPGDLVLDSFLGSGTTAAVAHKMGRKYIGIELGEHCYTHCLPRLKAVVDGEQGGISKTIEWQGGGGFKFYELAPTLIVRDKHGNAVISDKYNAQMLVAAIAKLNGYAYAPNPDIYWIQGSSQAGSYIYVTTEYLTAAQLDEISRDLPDYERLLICAPAFDVGLGKRYENINIRKIPQSVLDKCEYGAEDYNLNIISPPELDADEWEDYEDA